MPGAAGQGCLDYRLYLSLLQSHGFEGAIILHQLKELAPDRQDIAFTHVRDSAPELKPVVERFDELVEPGSVTTLMTRKSPLPQEI